ncbi:hypothetical protein E3N88_11888 [Mikania micrantha]|uniref:Uncharacterized protein n=1 Tax=Mikania micrantha TaxID=192012 RepID=A0A5N6P427_9ASTR|nr:hypothetical protein E3N88_11888 [Mikania micrantha]
MKSGPKSTTLGRMKVNWARECCGLHRGLCEAVGPSKEPNEISVGPVSATGPDMGQSSPLIIGSNGGLGLHEGAWLVGRMKFLLLAECESWPENEQVPNGLAANGVGANEVLKCVRTSFKRVGFEEKDVEPILWGLVELGGENPKFRGFCSSLPGFSVVFVPDRLYFRVVEVKSFNLVQRWMNLMNNEKVMDERRLLVARVFKTGFEIFEEEDEMKNKKMRLFHGIYTTNEFGFVFVARIRVFVVFPENYA